MTAHCLYRFYADDGALLYVGITNNPVNRFDSHASDKPWWHEVRGITMEPYPDRDSVLRAEARAIEVECPRHNKQRPRVDNRTPRRRAGREFSWHCDICAGPIADGMGYVEIDSREVMRVEAQERADLEAAAAGNDEVLYLDALDLPEPVAWHVWHAACDPDPGYSGYWFDVGRARTTAQLLRWSLHLMEKDWIGVTDWPAFVRARSSDDSSLAALRARARASRSAAVAQTVASRRPTTCHDRGFFECPDFDKTGACIPDHCGSIQLR